MSLPQKHETSRKARQGIWIAKGKSPVVKKDLFEISLFALDEILNSQSENCTCLSVGECANGNVGEYDVVL
jgi:hypothetical protein